MAIVFDLLIAQWTVFIFHINTRPNNLVGFPSFDVCMANPNWNYNGAEVNKRFAASSVTITTLQFLNNVLLAAVITVSKWRNKCDLITNA